MWTRARLLIRLHSPGRHLLSIAEPVSKLVPDPKVDTGSAVLWGEGAVGEGDAAAQLGGGAAVAGLFGTLDL
jgi:hypothetical protein